MDFVLAMKPGRVMTSLRWKAYINVHLCSLILKARFAENSENKRHLAGDNLAALVAWPFILLSNIQSEKLERNQVSSSQQR